MSKSAAATRQALLRQRKRKGVVVLQVEQHLDSLFEALVTDGLIGEEVEDPKIISAATTLALERWKKSVTRDAKKRR